MMTKEPFSLEILSNLIAEASQEDWKFDKEEKSVRGVLNTVDGQWVCSGLLKKDADLIVYMKNHIEDIVYMIKPVRTDAINFIAGLLPKPEVDPFS